MSLDSQSIAFDKYTHKNGLIYDAEGVTLIGTYGDELSAYRARRRWMEVFSNYFLLERERDYDLSVTASDEENTFALHATFISACGRYAFWRLINRQALEAEQKLCNEHSEIRGTRSLLSSIMSGEDSWVIEDETYESEGKWFSRLKEFFRG